MSVKYGILAILSRRPFYGYELKQEIEMELGVNWSVNYGQIYTTLDRLERGGFVILSGTVVVSDAPDRKLYTITPAGRDELNKWFLSPLTKIENLRDEFYAKVILSLTSSIPTEDVLQIQRKAELQKLHELTNLKERADQAIELPWILQLDLAILHTEATLRWLNMCEARLRKLKDIYKEGLAVKIRDTNKDIGAPGNRSDKASESIKEEGVGNTERSRQ
ncbi:MAG: PadR family transcriptional regulator [Actinobacteria bacterium]|nr:PadR family transcriptional regulator [Actinomycetota bacterium]